MSQALHDLLASQGIHIFKIVIGNHLGRNEENFWIHASKTTAEWRSDLRSFLEKSYHDATVFDEDGENIGGWAESRCGNALFKHLHDLGYVELDDVISDIFEGRITNEMARLVGDPNHPEQADGFGHYGWESKNKG